MNRIFSFGLLVMTAAAGAAQAGEQATFHLDFAARWGEVILQPGDYKVAIPEVSLGIPQFVVKGNEKTGYIYPMVTDFDGDLKSPPRHSYLQLEKVNGVYFVTKYRSEVTGKTFGFVVPKHKRQIEMSDKNTVRVGVSGNGE